MSLLSLLRVGAPWRLDPGAAHAPLTRNHTLFLAMLAGFGLSLAAGHGSFRPEPLILVYLPAAVWLLAWFYLRAISGGFVLEERRLVPVCFENERVRVELRLRYQGTLPFTLATAQDTFPAADILTGPELTLNSRFLDRAGRITLVYETEANRGYGDFLIGPLRLRISDPLHLFRQELDLPGTVPLKVILRQPAPDGLDLTKENAMTPIGDSRSTRTGPSLEFFGTKEYQAGDDIRAICWPKTAQLGRVILKTFELDTRPAVLLVINTEAGKVKGLGFGNNLKRILRVGAGVLAACRESALEARLVIAVGDRPEIIDLPPSPGRHLFAAEFLAKVEGSQGVDLPTLLAVAAGKAGPSTVLVVLSHTLDIDLDPVLAGLFAIKARQAKVCLWSLDDAKMMRFSEKQASEQIDKQVFVSRMEELGIPVRLLPARKAPPPEVANSREAES